VTNAIAAKAALTPTRRGRHPRSGRISDGVRATPSGLSRRGLLLGLGAMPLASASGYAWPGSTSIAARPSIDECREAMQREWRTAATAARGLGRVS
jgi:hypothetical protein